MHILAVDLEATCDNSGAISRHDMEIIEIGAVLVDEDNQIVDEFQTFIKPHRHPTLTGFCINLTHIQQSDIDSAPNIYEAFEKFNHWLKGYQPLEWCSWGRYDLRQMKQDCARSGAKWPIPGHHFNAKERFAKSQHTGKLGLHEAVEFVNLEWTGIHHRGIDDARNLAQLIRYLR